MKKILLISVLLGSLILVGCAKQQELSQENLFEKKQECAKYMNDLTKRNEQYNYSDSDKNGSISNSSQIEEIFYSPVVNSCVFTRTVTLFYKNEQGGNEINYWLIIEDALTHESIW
jgi:hypothetical protein